MEENGITEIKGLSKMHCNSEEEAMKYFFEGERHRSVAPHALNQVCILDLICDILAILYRWRETEWERAQIVTPFSASHDPLEMTRFVLNASPYQVA